MNLFRNSIEIAFAVLALLLVCAFLSIACSRAPDLAAWVQAVGAIAALGIAIYIMSRQNIHSAKLVADADRIATLRRVSSVQAIMRRYYMQLMLANTAVQSSDTSHDEHMSRERGVRAGLSAVKNMSSKLQAIPVFDIGSFELAHAILQFSEVVEECHTGLRAMCTTVSVRTPPASQAHFSNLVALAHKALGDYEKAANDLKESRGADESGPSL